MAEYIERFNGADGGSNADSKKVNCIERPRAACALSGALVTIGALPGVVAISHTALGCGGNLANASSFGSGYFGAGYCSGASVPTSAVTEKETIFGGVDRLREQIMSTEELIDARLFIVATGCMTEIIGDDVESVVGEFADAETPVLAVSTPSFKGDSYAGYEIVLDALFNRFVPPQTAKDPALVNIFGLVPAFDPFFRGDLAEIAALLARLGLRANTFFTPDQNFENILDAPKAALNIVFSRVRLAAFAEKFERKHGTPFWVTDLPIGAAASDRFLAALGQRLHIPAAKINALIETENSAYYGYFERTVDLVADGDLRFYTSTVTNGNYAIPALSFAQNELGWVALEAFVTDQLDEKQRSALLTAWAEAELAAPLFFETDTGRIAKTIAGRHPLNRGQRYFDDDTPLYILGSTLERPLAAKRGASQLSISFPVFNRLIVDRGYAGYRGGLHFLEDIYSAFVAPRGGG
jgi:nitrogenase molybdenum-iron protein beta chain